MSNSTNSERNHTQKSIWIRYPVVLQKRGEDDYELRLYTERCVMETDGRILMRHFYHSLWLLRGGNRGMVVRTVCQSRTLVPC